ncbi:MAG: CTP synthase [Patescibacteria group bacterium]
MAVKKRHKYIFVIGGVMSGVGKGITTSSIGTVLQSKGYKVSLIKADPYLNVDAGTMNPTEHGEVFVLDSGLETDQDMGNYERFLGTSSPSENYMTNGMVFKYVIDKERALGYKGKCVEPVFHITEEILRRIKKSVEKTNSEITVVEIGGTVGEYQNAIFIEAARMIKLKYPKDVLFVLVSYFPVPNKIGEMKTKPTQNAVRQLSSYGVNADIIVARSEMPLDNKRKEKVASASGINPENVISAPDVESIYDVPLNFERDKFSEIVLRYFGLKSRQKDLQKWRRFVDKFKNSKKEVKIGIVGKYFDTGNFVLSDAYISVIEALKISAAHLGLKAKIDWLNAKNYESNSKQVKELSKYQGILVPGGFGESGIEGKIAAIKFCRQNKIPFFGLCYGMQLAVIEYARSMLGWKDAHTTEINPKTKHPVIDILPEQRRNLEESKMGGSMRLGSYPCLLKKGTIARDAYKNEVIRERHRHRYEVNPEFIDDLEKAGLIFSGISPDGRLMEIAELAQSKHPFFLGTQFHPEFLARPLSPHPLFTRFIKTAMLKKDENQKTRSQRVL